MKKRVVMVLVILAVTAGCSSSSAFDVNDIARKAKKNLDQMSPQKASICKIDGAIYGSQIYDHFTRRESKVELLEGYKKASLSYDVSKAIIDYIYDAKTAGELPNNEREAAVLGVYICTKTLK